MILFDKIVSTETTIQVNGHTCQIKDWWLSLKTGPFRKHDWCLRVLFNTPSGTMEAQFECDTPTECVQEYLKWHKQNQ